MGIQLPKSRKIAIFGINLPLWKKFVITNFVIPRRDKQKKTNEKHHTFSSTPGARPTIPAVLGMVIEEFRPIFAPPLTFF